MRNEYIANHVGKRNTHTMVTGNVTNLALGRGGFTTFRTMV